jgi:hypothetical protein
MMEVYLSISLGLLANVMVIFLIAIRGEILGWW